MAVELAIGSRRGSGHVSLGGGPLRRVGRHDPAREYATQTDDLYGQISLAIEAANDGLGHALCFYGAGNHGGGPTKKNIEYILANARAWPEVELRFSTPEAFFEAVSRSRHLLPTRAGELQHTFPGCYSVMHDIKQRQYHNEHLLDQCERIIGRYAEHDGVRRRLQRQLDEAWDDLVFTQFHDTLAGTSVPSAYGSVRALQGRAQAIGEEIAFAVTRRWTRRALEPLSEHQITIINPDPEPWEGLIATEPWLDFDSWGERWLSDVAGHEVDFQLVQPEAHQLTSRVQFACRVEPGGTEHLGDLHLAVVTGDCYSASLDGGIWQWTLLRSPKAAWGGGEPEVYAGRDEHTDQGRHGFELILWPDRDLAQVALATAARQQAQPPVVLDRYEGLDRPPWGDVPPPAFRLEAVQRALRDGRLSHLADTEEALRRPFVPPEERP